MRFLFGLLVLPGTAWADRTVAVMPLKAGGPATVQAGAYEGLGTALAGMLVTDLVQVPGLVLVERERVNDLLAEMKLAETGFLDPATAARMGKGLGAQLILEGHYAIVGEQLHLDVQLRAVETGAIVSAVDRQGPVAEWVDVEKQIVEELVDGLAIDLTVAARRNLLLAAPTEDLEALARYGRGLEAADRGDWDAARIAYEAALREDPDFALPKRALAALGQRVAAAQATEEAAAQVAKLQAYEAALAQLPSELERPAKFRDTRESEMDQGIRWAILRRLGRSCDLLAEQAHYFDRRQGRWTWWTEALPGKTPLARSELGIRLFDERGTALGLVGPGTPYGTRPGELYHDASELLYGPVQFLVAGNLKPENFGHSVAATVRRCVPPADAERAWAEWIARIDRGGLADFPGWTEYGQGPSPVTVGVIARLYRAFLRADAVGQDPEVARLAEAELARFPEGSPGRPLVLNRITEVLGAAAAHDRRAAQRLGLSPDALTAAARAVASRSNALHLDGPLCAALAENQTRFARNQLDALAAKPDDPNRLDALGSTVAPLVFAGCLRGQTPLSYVEVLVAVEEALTRPHPGALGTPSCAERATAARRQLETLRGEPWASFAAPMQAPQVAALLSDLHGQRAALCLL